MKTQPKQTIASKLAELRAGVVAAIAELDLKGSDTKITQAMCIVEAGFDAAARRKRIVPQQVFLSGMAKAQGIK